MTEVKWFGVQPERSKRLLGKGLSIKYVLDYREAKERRGGRIPGA
jgi:hypothetical protein